MTFKHLRRGAVVAAVALALAPALASASFAAGKPPSGSAPATPGGVTVTSGNRSLIASWTETSSGAITFTATARATGKSTRSCSTNKLGCPIVSLANGVVYDVTVVAKSKGGTSAPSSVVTDIVGVPGFPLSIRATAGTAMATIAWAPPKASGVTKVTSYMATASPGGFSCSTASTVLSSAPARTCQIPGLTSGTKYTVTVTATNAYGTGTPSRTAAVTPT